MEVIGSEKHPNLLQYSNNYSCKKVYSGSSISVDKEES
jgi:hypothetical protein